MGLDVASLLEKRIAAIAQRRHWELRILLDAPDLREFTVTVERGDEVPSLPERATLRRPRPRRRARAELVHQLVRAAQILRRLLATPHDAERGRETRAQVQLAHSVAELPRLLVKSQPSVDQRRSLAACPEGFERDESALDLPAGIGDLSVEALGFRRVCDHRGNALTRGRGKHHRLRGPEMCPRPEIGPR